MHERSLVNALLKHVDVIGRLNNAEHVTEVRVEVGPLSGVEPLLLASAFEELVIESKTPDAKLVIDEVALVGQCKTCGRESEVKDFDFRCRTCGGGVRVIRGDELQLISVSLQSREPTQEMAS